MLSVIIVNYKNPPLLRLCLGSLVQNVSPDFDFEVIVVDSEASLETEMVVTEEFSSKFKHIRYAPFTENTGYTRGVNEGLKLATGDYMLVLNPDVIILKDSLEKLTAYMSEHPEIGLIGPELLNFNGTHQPSCFRFYSPLTVISRRISHLPFAGRINDRFLLKDIDLSKPIAVDWIMGSAYMTSRQALEKTGLLDEYLFHYFSDVDWAQRFWDNGLQVVYYPYTQIYHYHQRESKGSLGLFDIFTKKATRWHIRDAIRYFRKHGIRIKTKVPVANAPLATQNAHS
ncbi:MAG: glycosyltransferase family 2 protein [Candidatus Yanofskybacteria bacterium]|nr:glycosyltransferase family 2 protein [Candidatus Yanofskybacteria bacterium]